MRSEQTKKLSNRELKRLVGVQRRTFYEFTSIGILYKQLAMYLRSGVRSLALLAI